MERFRNLSIKHKLVLLSLLVSGIGLFLACSAFLVYEIATFRGATLKSLTAHADMAGYHSSAALAFDDADKAKQTLQSLEIEPHITMGCIYRKNGTVLALYSRAGLTQPPHPAAQVDAGWIADSHAHVFRPIRQNGELIGMAYLRSDLRGFEQRLAAYVGLAAAVLCLILLIIWWAAERFQALVSGPVIHLVETVNRIGSGGDYAVRARKHGEDELGTLVDAFNRMLGQIQARDQELEQARAELEKRVEERTADLQAQVIERERTQEQLLKQQEFDRNVLDMVPSLIFVKDARGKFVLANRATAELYQTTPEQMIGNTDTDIVPALAATPAFGSDDCQVIESGRDKFIPEEPVKTDSGEVRWMQTVKRRILSPAGEPQVLAVATDITLRRMAEAEMHRAKDAAESANRSKSEFLANMSHEIRTPMNGIIGMARLLLETKLDEDQRDFARTIASSSESLLTILSDILDISKIEAGKLSFERIPFNLREAVEGPVELLAPRAHEKGLDLTCLIESDVGTQMHGDPHRLRQVLLNLIGNAVKFTQKGAISLRVMLLERGFGRQRLLFEIQDSGIGISQEVQARLFQPFTQADGSTTRKFGGTGLGLFISKQLVDLMEGQISIASAPGRGSTFSFTVTLDCPEPAAEGAKAFAGCVVLIAAQREAHRAVLRHYLAAEGADCLEADSAVQALSMLRQRAQAGEPAHLAIVESHFASLEENGLARALRDDPALAGTQLLLLAMRGGEPGAGNRAENSLPCLHKPVKRDLLVNCVRLMIGRKDLPQSTPAEEAADVPETPPARPAARILVAEDNIVNQRVAMRFLRKLGYSADLVPNGAKAVAALEQCHYDLVLMDCQMPEMDGYEAARRIREEERREGADAAHRVSIVAMTANAMKGDREKCLEAGMDDYVSKPIKIEVLEETILRQLKAEAARSLKTEAAPALKTEAAPAPQAHVQS